MYSKYGCQTCKVRKVKCDEAYPACRRCTSTGRKCDGYNRVGSSGLHRPVPTSMRVALYINMSPYERQYLEWFGLRTSKKLPGTCQSEFWSKLIPQASHSQPAILHASLALGALHREIALAGPTPRLANARWAMRQSEKQPSGLSVCNYLKAIRHLRVHASLVDEAGMMTGDRDSLQALLIACLLFISLECMRGHLVAAHTHIQSGLAILKDTGWEVDTWIMDAFARIELQLTLWTMSASSTFNIYPKTVIVDDCIPSPSRHFGTLKEAWSSLGDAITKSVGVTRVTYDSKMDGTFFQKRDSLCNVQRSILRALRSWKTRYDLALKKGQLSDLNQAPSSEKEKMALILPVYHDMATIMAELCLCAGDEMAFDTQIHRFVCMLRRLKDVYKQDQHSPERPDLRHFIMDLGCLAPLHYLATKCRNHTIRWQAAEMLDSVFHREGIWDAQITAVITRKIIEAEEGDYFDELAQDTVQQFLPISRRVGRFNVILQGNPTESIVVHFENQFRVGVRQYMEKKVRLSRSG